MNPKVSIIVPFYNSQEYLKATLQSIASQSYTGWECLCIDDGSTDQSAAIVREFSSVDSRFKLYPRPEVIRKGGNACRNYGFTKANGEYIQWFDSDDLMQEDMIYHKVNALDKNTTANYVICRTAYFSSSVDELTPYEQHLTTDNVLLDYLTFKTKFFTPGPMFRKCFLVNMKLFDIDLKRHQEKEFFFRIILKDKNYLLIDEPLVWRRIHDSSLSVSVNNSKVKTMLELDANIKLFRHYIASGLKKQDVTDYFRHFFFRYTYLLLRQRRFSAAVKSTYNFFRSIIE